MMKALDLPQTIPVFPLPGALLLPRGTLPLHIFEPRYLAMIEDCMKTPHRLIGMVQPREVPGGAEKRLQSIGCAGRLTGMSETEDGRYMVTLTGTSRYRLREVHEGFHPYLCADVSWDGFGRDLGPPERDPDFDRERFMALLARYFDAADLKTDWESLSDAEDELLINALSMLCPFDSEDKQALLEAPTLTTRRETLVTLIEFSLYGGDEEILQ